jgi:putative ABC transport system permease protein
MVSSKQFPRTRLYQAQGVSGVESATAVYMRLVSWRNPVDPSNARNILAIGFDPSEPGFQRLLSAEQIEAIKIPDQVIFDRRGRDEYGPVRELLDAGQPVSAEINDRRVAIDSMYTVGTSFGLDGGVITSDLNFLRMLSDAANPKEIGHRLWSDQTGSGPGCGRSAGKNSASDS